MKRALVTGATGHLGGNLVKELVSSGYTVKAVVRNKEKAEAIGIKSPNVEIVVANLTDLSSTMEAIKDVDIVFQAAANFSHWSKDPDKDIVAHNNTITHNVLKAAKNASVEKVIFVSSIGALKRNTGSAVGPDEWIENTYGNPYFESKRQSERLAWSLSKELGVNMISVLPGAMVGGTLDYETPTSRFLNAIQNGEVPFDLNFEFNLVHVSDVCKAMVQTASKGVIGKRYILANAGGVSFREICNVYHTKNPKVKLPLRVGKTILLIIATIEEFTSKLRGREPSLLRSQVNFYYSRHERFDISSSVSDLEFSPQSSRACL